MPLAGRTRGLVTFSYEASDGLQQSAPAGVTITVSALKLSRMACR